LDTWLFNYKFYGASLDLILRQAKLNCTQASVKNRDKRFSERSVKR
jgi:hypothetical protein